MYKRYGNYKDSGIEWIGEVPDHWTDYKLKQLFLLIGGNGFNEALQGKKEGDYPFYKVSDINFGETVISEASNYVDRSDVKTHRWNVIPKNSILMAKIGEALRKNHRKINNADCIIDNNMLALIPRNRLIDTWLAYYLFTKIDMDWYVNPGAVPSVNMRWLKNSKLLLMPESEQRNIINFLDHKTSEIDSLIADKEELIKRLEEYKQSIITEAVTKGLNPDVKMKDSGIEWIGEIPEHWNVVKIKHLLKSHKNAIKVGPFGSQLTADEMANGEIKVYNQRNVYDKNYSVGENFISLDKYKSLKGFRVYPDDILFTTRGTIGQAYVLPKESEIGVLHPCLMRIQVKSDLINKHFIEEIFNETKIATKQIFYESNSTTIEVIYSETLKNLVLPLPDVNEQEIILEKNKEFKITCDTLIKNAQTQIEKLKSYRQSLIYEAVTGKIDVRDYQLERSEQLA